MANFTDRMRNSLISKGELSRSHPRKSTVIPAPSPTPGVTTPTPETITPSPTPGVTTPETQLRADVAGSSVIGSQGLGGAATVGSRGRNQLVSREIAANINAPTVPRAALQTVTPIQVRANEISAPRDPRFQIGDTGLRGAQGAPAVPGAQIRGAQAELTEAALTGAASAEAATQNRIVAGQAAEAALGNVPPETMVQNQMEELTAGLESGEIPLWARPAVDAVEAQLAARGLSRSSVGQATLSNAIIQAALPMAQQNAQTVAQNFQADKANQQAANLFNAQGALALQQQSLTNRQQTALSNSNQRQQSMLSNQASRNSARQFNAQSQTQTAQFMSSLQAQVQNNNLNRLDATRKFNANAVNAMQQFNVQQRFAKQQFNAQNATVIEQSNLQWRRQINVTNTAGINAVNQANAMNAFNLSNQALTFMWQEMRDSAKWSFEAFQNERQREAALAQAAMQNEAISDAGTVKLLGEAAKLGVSIWKINKGVGA